MSITSFIPQVWSEKILEALHLNVILGALCSRDYEEDLKEYGDVVHIGTLRACTIRPYTNGQQLAAAEALDGSDQTLMLDHSVYAHVYASEMNVRTAKADLLAAATRMIGRRFAEDTETYLYEVITDGAGITGTLDISGDMVGQLYGIMTAMDQRNVPKQGRSLIVPPTLEGAMPRYTGAVSQMLAPSAQGAKLGARYSFAGFDVYSSNDLVDEVIGLAPGAIQMAQRVNVEIYHPDQTLNTAIKALSLCGAKVVLPDAVALYSLS